MKTAVLTDINRFMTSKYIKVQHTNHCTHMNSTNQSGIAWWQHSASKSN